MTAIAAKPGLADQVLLDATIWTGAPNQPSAEAIALRGEEIVAVGSRDEVLECAGRQTEVLSFGGLTVVPGFIDPHVHTPETGRFNRGLEGARDLDDLLGRLKAHLDTLPEGQWAYVRFTLSRPELWLRRHHLDSVSGDRPLFMGLSGHVYAANSRALALGGVTKDTPDPFGGSLERDADGEPTGLLFDTARFLILEVMPRTGRRNLEQAIAFAQHQLVEAGITTHHDMVVDAETVSAYQRLRERGELTCRATMLLRAYESKISMDSIEQLGLSSSFGDEWLKIGGVKFSLDGQFPSRGGLMHEPYCCGENVGSGVLRIPPEEFNELVARAHRQKLQVCVHAVGDRAQDMTLDAFEAAGGGQSVAAGRHRIEHCANVNCTPAMRQRLAKLGVIAVPNPPFLYFRGQMALPYLGPERAQYVVNMRDLLDDGVTVALASDWPGLGSMNPFIAMYTLVTRRTLTDELLQPEQALTVEEVLSMFTRNNAWVDFSETRKGSLEAGKLADLAVLSENPLRIDPLRLREVSAVGTMVGGKFVYQDAGFSPAVAGG